MWAITGVNVSAQRERRNVCSEGELVQKWHILFVDKSPEPFGCLYWDNSKQQ